MNQALIIGSLFLFTLILIVICLILYYREKKADRRYLLQQRKLSDEREFSQAVLTLLMEDQQHHASFIRDEVLADLSTLFDTPDTEFNRLLLSRSLASLLYAVEKYQPFALKAFGLVAGIQHLILYRQEITVNFQAIGHSRYPGTTEWLIYRLVDVLFSRSHTIGVEQVTLHLRMEDNRLFLSYSDDLLGFPVQGRVGANPSLDDTRLGGIIRLLGAQLISKNELMIPIRREEQKVW